MVCDGSPVQGVEVLLYKEGFEAGGCPIPSADALQIVAARIDKVRVAQRHAFYLLMDCSPHPFPLFLLISPPSHFIVCSLHA